MSLWWNRIKSWWHDFWYAPRLIDQFYESLIDDTEPLELTERIIDSKPDPFGKFKQRQHGG